MIKTRHTEIRAEMVRHGYDGKRLAPVLGISTVTLSLKLCGKAPWTSREMYIIMDLFGLPYAELGRFFPKNGISDPTCYRQLPTDLPMFPQKIKAV